ncbi:MAG: hypothetical protein KQJ78_00285 [Deltaproteobacteria bacterium]|nr:hypothetical protein [Deltaproteobacteria bacterium]
MSLLTQLNRLEARHRELLSLARMTLSLAQRDDLAALEDTFNRRRLLSQEVEAQFRKLAPLWPRWDQELAALPPDQAGQAQDLVNRIAALGHEIVALDRQAADRLTELKDQTAQGLGRAKQGKKLLNAYRSLPKPGSGLGQVSKSG